MWRFDVLTKRLIILAALMAAPGCSVQEQNTPLLNGSSEMSVSLTITATPDIIPQDGQSQATIHIFARRGENQPVQLNLQLETLVGDVAADVGTLSSKFASTGSDGKATLTYRAPPAPSVLASSDQEVQVRVTPVGANYGSTVPRFVQIKLTRPGVILPPNGAPTASFLFSPSTPRENDSILFDGSASTDDGQIVSYAWDFGDGGTASGSRVFHSYGLLGAYSVVLTVTDDRGQTSSTSKSVTVGVAALPVANFTFSPTSPVPGQNVNLNASLSSVPTGRRIVAYKWDFGDGSPQTESPAPITAHAYNVIGTYTIVLTVTDDTGRVGATSKTVPVGIVEEEE